LLNLYVSNNNLELVLKKQTCLTLFMEQQPDFCYMANITELISDNKIAIVFDSACVFLERLFYCKNLEVSLQIQNIIFKAFISLSNDQTKVLIEIKEQIAHDKLLSLPIFIT
jgi:hypothetical protein